MRSFCRFRAGRDRQRDPDASLRGAVRLRSTLAPKGKGVLKVVMATSYRMWEALAHEPERYHAEAAHRRHRHPVARGPLPGYRRSSRSGRCCNANHHEELHRQRPRLSIGWRFDFEPSDGPQAEPDASRSAELLHGGAMGWRAWRSARCGNGARRRAQICDRDGRKFESQSPIDAFQSGSVLPRNPRRLIQIKATERRSSGCVAQSEPRGLPCRLKPLRPRTRAGTCSSCRC